MKPGQSAPRRETYGLRQRAWWMMRRHGVFTVAELLATLATGAEGDAGNNLGQYARALASVGILVAEGRALEKGPHSRGYIRYRLVVDNGRKAPVWRREAGQVYDPNNGAVYPVRGGDRG